MMKRPDSNLQTVKTLLGHSSINTTLEYVEGNVDTVREALEAQFARRKKDNTLVDSCAVRAIQRIS